MLRWTPDLALLLAALALLASCASPPCPTEFALYGGREWGKTRSAFGTGKHQQNDTGEYRGYNAGASLTFDLGTHRSSCPAWAGEGAFEAAE